MAKADQEQTQTTKHYDREYIEPRTGIKRKIVRVYFDPQANCVFDEYEVTRKFKDSDKKFVTITTLRRSYSQDEELQKKHRVVKNVTRVVEL